MNYSFQRLANYALCIAVALCLTGVAAQAQSKKMTKKINEATARSQKAAKVFTEIMAAPDKGIPKDWLDKAEAVAVFPNVIKAGFIIGGRGGSGVISRRVKGGWSAPAFFKLGGGSMTFWAV